MPFAPLSKQQQENLQPKTATQNVSGTSTSFASVVPGQEKKEKSSGQFANLQQYIQANQPQAQQMGQKLAQDVEQSGQAASQKIQSFEQQKPQVQAFDPNMYIQKAPQLSAEEKQTYQQTKQTGGYTGPQQLEQVSGYTEAQKEAQKAADKAKQAGTESGQQELLRQSFARPDYTMGQTKLDQVLLGGNQQAKQQLSDLSQRYSDLYNVFNQKAADVGSAVNQAVQQSLANRQAIQQAEPQAWQQLLNPLQQRAQKANVENPQIQQEIMSDISDDALLQSTLDRLGLSSGQKLYDLDLASYLTPNQTQLGINDVATLEERQKYKALADLFQDQSRTEIGEQGLSPEAIKFNKQQFETDLSKKDKEYQNAYNTVKIANNMSAKELEEQKFPELDSDLSALNSGNGIPAYLFSKYGVPVDLPGNAGKNMIGSRIIEQKVNFRAAIDSLKNQFKTNRQIGVQS